MHGNKTSWPIFALAMTAAVGALATRNLHIELSRSIFQDLSLLLTITVASQSTRDNGDLFNPLEELSQDLIFLSIPLTFKL